jgi:hypothetical protein
LSWGFIVEEKLAELGRFKQLLRPDERAFFEGLLAQCKHYAVKGEVFASRVREMSPLFSMVYAQHKKLMELERRLDQSLR